MSDDTVKLDRGYFVAFALEGVLWGCHIVIFTLAFSVLVMNRKRRPMSIFLFTAMIVLFVFCTTHFSLIFTNVYRGLMVQKYSIGTEDNLLIGADLIIFITDSLSQMVLTYRCWLVWQKRYYIVVLPLLMSLTSLSCGLSAVGLLISIDPNAPFAPPAVYRFAEVALGLPLGTNILLTSLITGRIWWYVSRGSPDLLPSKSIQAAMAVIVESGALVVVAQIASCVLFVLNNPNQNIATCASLQLYGIAPALIILRVGMGNAIDTNKTRVSTFSPSTAKVTALNFADPGTVSFTTDKQQHVDVEHGSFGADTGASTIGIDTRITNS